jgi:glycosyltransferase involved in cell wall biosynthesis
MGGAEWVIADILAGMRVERPTWRLSLIVPAEGRFAQWARSQGVDVVVVSMKRGVARLGDTMVKGVGAARLLVRIVRSAPEIIAYGLRLRRVLREWSPDIVHAHGFKMQLLAMWTRRSRVPVVLHLHDYIGQRALMSRALRLPLRRPVAAVAISRSVADDARRVTGGRLPIHIVYNAVDVEHWSPRGRTADLDGLAGLEAAPPGTIRVGLVGTFARWKGHDVFLRALSMLPHGLRIRAYIVGGSIYRTDGSQFSRDELERLASDAGVPNPIGFTGFVDEPAEAMRSLDIVIHASTRPEPFGRVIIEGMALERAVIVSGAGGAAELIVPGMTALSFRPGDARALAGAIETLTGNADLRRSLGAQGRAHVVERFSREVMVRSLVAVYDSLCPSPLHSR